MPFGEMTSDLLGPSFAFLPVRSLSMASQVCKQWSEACSDDALWRLHVPTCTPAAAVLFQEHFLSTRLCAAKDRLGCPAWRDICRRRAAHTPVLVLDCGSAYAKVGLVGRDVGVQPSMQPVLVVEPLLEPFSSVEATRVRKQVRETLATALFTHLKVPSACFVNEAVLCLYNVNQMSGMVVNIGFINTTIVPVLNSKVMRQHTRVVPLGAMHMSMYLGALMDTRGYTYNNVFVLRAVKEATVFVAKVRTCRYCSSSSFSLRSPVQTAADVKGDAHHESKSVFIPNEGLFTLDRERCLAPELFFDPKLVNVDCPGLHTALADAISSCHADAVAENGDDSTATTAPWYSNIVLAGGTAQLPGLCERIRHEMSAGLPIPQLASHITVSTAQSPNSSAAQQCTSVGSQASDHEAPVAQDVQEVDGHWAWEGGRLVAECSSFQKKWCVTAAEYEAQGPALLHRLANDSLEPAAAGTETS